METMAAGLSGLPPTGIIMPVRPIVYLLLVMSFSACQPLVLETPPLAGISPPTQCRSPQATEEEKFGCVVKEAHARFKDDTEGERFKDIDYLANVDPKLFGVAIVTVKGKVYAAGNSEYAFPIESLSKPFTLALVMQDQKEAAVVEKIGVEPTGMPFNSVLAIEAQKFMRDRPAGNPLVNAGAIAAVSLVNATSKEERWERIRRAYDKFAGTQLQFNKEVYKSEMKTNQHNRGIAELLRSYKRLYADPVETVEVYTKQCSVGVTTTQLAKMGATLANGGVNPVTGTQAVDAKFVPKILSVMMMAGFYDGAGRWAWDTGLPAKTGVGGGIVAVVPGRFAIAAFSPPLDTHGNSVRAAKTIHYISEQLGTNLFNANK